MERSQFKDPDAKPTGKQIYALASMLCRHVGEKFPATRYEASELMNRVQAGTVGGDAPQSEETVVG
jgi:hypothetical protein